MLSALVAALHYLTLALGLGSVFMRGVYLRSPLDPPGLARLFRADSAWGVAAILWITTGLARAFGGLEKGSHYYLHSHGFWLKMALFGTVFLLELRPMITFIRWRIALKKGTPPNTEVAAALARINDVETVLTVMIVFAAAAMARGLW
jgi:putative membrane protein